MNDVVRGDGFCHSAAGTAQTTAEFLTRFQTFPERYHRRSAPIALCERATANAAALQEVFIFLSGSRNTCHSVSAFSAHRYGVKKIIIKNLSSAAARNRASYCVVLLAPPAAVFGVSSLSVLGGGVRIVSSLG